MITIVQEPKEISREFGHSRERCCFCRAPTPHWTAIPERTPGEQVACCPECGETRSPEEVPSKTEWCASERALRKA